MALYHRQMTGEGQQVDISTQATTARLIQPLGDWDMIKLIPRRGVLSYDNVRVTRMWTCKDGYVMWFYWGGPQGKRWNPAFIEWMDSKGMANDFLKEFDWETLDHATVSQEVMDRIEEPTAKFFMAHTKQELLEGAVKRSIMLCPVATTTDILRSPQLPSRGFWMEVEHPELGTTITYPGAFAHSSEAPPRISRRAPLVGEHNGEIYEKELGLSKEEILALKQANVI